jgi:hypothetical protein
MIPFYLFFLCLILKKKGAWLMLKILKIFFTTLTILTMSVLYFGCSGQNTKGQTDMVINESAKENTISALVAKFGDSARDRIDKQFFHRFHPTECYFHPISGPSGESVWEFIAYLPQF